MSRAEYTAVQDAAFLKKQYDADQVHREKIKRAETDAKVEQEATRKRPSKRTGPA